MSFLLGIVFFILIVFFLIISIGASFLRLLFRRPASPFDRQTNNRSYKNDSAGAHNNTHSTHTTHKKVFNKDEGEYIDFEEIK